VHQKPDKVAYAMRGKKRAATLAVCLLIALLFTWADRNYFQNNPRFLSQTSNHVIANDITKYHEKKFTVVKVVDGDTIDIGISDGKFEGTRVRLWGVDTPETKSDELGVMYYGREASEYTKELVMGKEVGVYLSQERTRGKYGRLLAYVLMEDGRFLNEVLISEGYGYADLRFEHSYYNKYQQLQASAVRGKKGLWKEVSREQLPDWLRERKPKLLKGRKQ